jgi:NTP pyrophosphatase (non-canonical NTP hydrolase)
MKELEKLIELVAYKHEIDMKRADKKYMDTDWIAQSIVDEVDEVKEEIRPNNRAYLEDELSDILWGWLTLVEKLKSSGYVESHNSIIIRGLKKYEERILPLTGDKRDCTIWREVKEKQKKVLEIEQQALN